MSIGYQLGNFFRRNGGTILTVLSSIGVGATAYFSGKAAIKIDKELETLDKNAPLKEKIKTLAPLCIIPAAAGAATILCIFGANGLNRRQQASMLATGALVEETYRRYKDKAEALLGDNVVNSNIAKETKVPDVGSDERLFYYEYYTDEDHLENGSYFTSTVEKVFKAEMELNRMFMLRKTVNPNNAKVTLNEFFDLLDLKHVNGGDNIGWSNLISDEFFGYSWIDFEHVDTTLLDGLECTIIDQPAHIRPSILA